jgi:hypothetical protein
MPVRLLRRILSLLIVTAYVGATMLQTALSFAADTQNYAAMGGMMQDQDHPGDTTPCKGKMPGCVSDLGCIFLVSLPAPDLTLVTVAAWSFAAGAVSFARSTIPFLTPPAYSAGARADRPNEFTAPRPLTARATGDSGRPHPWPR